VHGAHSTAVKREWKQAGSYEETPMFEPLWRIDVEDGYRGACDRRRANQRGTIPVEVLRPYVRSRGYGREAAINPHKEHLGRFQE